MEAIVKCDNHGVHFGVGEQGGVAGEGSRNPQFRCRGARPVTVTAGDGHEFQTGPQPTRLSVFTD